jgi:TRAP-type C4-dicarboxylate transport system substrate-binding protein
MADTRWMDAAPTDGSSVARTKFAEYMKMTPAEKMHAAMLQRLGVSEEEFKAMSADERAAIETKIKDMIKAEVENGPNKGETGLLADLKV